MTRTIKRANKYQFIRESILRRYSKRWPAFNECLNKAKVEGFIIHPTTGKKHRRVYYRCADCEELYTRKQVCVDHIEEVTPAHLRHKYLEDPDSVDWNIIINRMFCEVDGLQVLCNYRGEWEDEETGNIYRSCHYWKTKEERERSKKCTV